LLRCGGIPTVGDCCRKAAKAYILGVRVPSPRRTKPERRMKPNLAQRVLGLMTQKAPRQAAEALLEYLANDSGASGAALFTVDDDACALFIGAPISQDGLDWCFGAWSKSKTKLKDGFSVQKEARSLFPLRANAAHLVGLVYIEAPHVEELPLLEVSPDLTAALLRCQNGPCSTALDDYIQNTPRDEFERKKLELLLNAHEWNISRVARILGYTRITVYRHLERLGIPRLKTGKGEA
jgi:hypothetical protein